MLLLSGVFKPSGPEREQDHRRSMANLSLFHRPSLILLICLPFVEAHSQFPEFRIRPCFVTKTAQVIMLNRWTKGWTMDEGACEFVSICVYGYWVYAKFMTKFMRIPIHVWYVTQKWQFVIFCIVFVVALMFTKQHRICNILLDTVQSDRIPQLNILCYTIYFICFRDIKYVMM